MAAKWALLLQVMAIFHRLRIACIACGPALKRLGF
jgi:hypothetical protein